MLIHEKIMRKDVRGFLYELSLHWLVSCECGLGRQLFWCVLVVAGRPNKRAPLNQLWSVIFEVKM